MRYSFILFKGLQDEGIDVVCPTQNLSTRSFGSVSSIAIYDFLLPLFLRRKRFDLYHATFPQQALWFSLFVGKKTIVTVHELFRSRAQGFTHQLWNSYNHLVLKSIKAATHIIAVSSQTRDDLVSKLHVDEDRISVIPLGVDHRFTPRTGYSHGDEIVVGYVGGLDPRKGIDFLRRVIDLCVKKRMSEKIKFVLCGAGPLYGQLLNWVNRKSLTETVRLKGYVKDSDLPELYRSLDIFLFPSLLEGFGLPILEAQRSGVPVLIRRDAAIPEETRAKAVACTDESDAIQKILLLSDDYKTYKHLSQEGVNYARRFSWERTVRDTIEVYKRVCNA